MRERLLHVVQPLNLAAAFTLAAIGYGLRYEVPAAQQPLVWLLVGLMLLAIVAQDWMPRHSAARAASYLFQAACAFTLIAMAPRTGVAPVTLVILIAELAMEYRPRVLLVLAVLINVLLYATLVWGGHGAPQIQLFLYIGFQAFAALTTHYARSAEEARDRLALVNADLLATRALLADSARDNERLRVARELHDVAGHKLTAMTLNLRALAADPAFAGRHEVALAQQLSGELLADIRGIVQAMRHDRGLDLATALRALAAPLPRPSLRLDIEESVHVTDPAVAETVLRLVQEALTNSARHADADVVRVSLQSRDGRLRIRVEDDGHVRGALREGKRPFGHARTRRRRRRTAAAEHVRTRRAAHRREPAGMSATPIRIALADDQALVRAGLRALLERHGIVVAFEADDGAQLLERLADTPVDVVLSDIRMAGVDGIEALQRLRARGDRTPVLLLTTFDESELLLRATQAGAQGFLLKDAAPEDLREAIARVAAGETLLQPVSTEPVRARYQYHQQDAPREHFTEREVAILRLIAGGYSNKEIARAMFLAEGTVKNYVSVVLEKLGTRDRTRAVLKAITLRVI